MRKGFLNAGILYLALTLWAVYRIWTGIQSGSMITIILWAVLAVATLLLYIFEWKRQKGRSKNQQYEGE